MKKYTITGSRDIKYITFLELGDYKNWQEILFANGIYDGSILNEKYFTLSLLTEEETDTFLETKYNIPGLKFF